MAKRYNSNDTKITKIISIALVVVLVVVIGVIIFKNVFGEEPPKTLPSTYDQVATTELIEATTSNSSEESKKPTDKEANKGETSATEPTTEKVVVPSDGGEDAKYFSGIYTPYRVVDTLAEEFEEDEVTLREAFGEAYSGGLIAFYKDGTFKDTVTTSSANSGSYKVSGEMIIATYADDKNMEITVTGWSGGRPAEFMIEYGGGYQVYFGL